MGRKNRREGAGSASGAGPRRGKRRSIRYDAAEDVPSRARPSRVDAPPSLHLRRLTAAEALARLEQAVTGYVRLGRPELLVIHGRGLHSSAGEPVLAPLVRQWCDEHPGLVIDWRPAPPAWGGEGAIVLRLRAPGPRRGEGGTT